MKRSGKAYLWQHPDGAWYVRLDGKYTRIRAEHGTPEFDSEYWSARSGKTVQAKANWRSLIKSYQRSDRWERLAPRTQADYQKVLTYLIEKVGQQPVKALKRKHVIDAMNANKDRTRFANYIPAVMSVLCEHAIDQGWLTENPAKGVRKLRTPEGKKQPHIPWPDWAVEKWRAEASALPRLVFELGVGSVQRPGDWVKFRWNDYDGECLRVTQGKTGIRLLLPCTDHLKAALDSAPKEGMTILTRRDGRPLPYRRMAEMMRAERDRLGLLDYDLHALRYRGVQELTWAGCTDDEIASYSGHMTKAMIAKYAGEARQIMRARQAKEKRR